jgi:hypothetical protein
VEDHGRHPRTRRVGGSPSPVRRPHAKVVGPAWVSFPPRTCQKTVNGFRSFAREISRSVRSGACRAADIRIEL